MSDTDMFENLKYYNKHQDELPDCCFVHIEGEDSVRYVMRGKGGYWPVTDVLDFGTDDFDAWVFSKNKEFSVTPEQAEALQFGSIFWW